MKRNFILISAIIFLQTGVLAQNTDDRKSIIQQTNTSKLTELSAKYSAQYENSILIAKKEGIPLEVTSNNGEIGYFTGFDTVGKPVYDFDDNVNAAISSRVDRIWNGGTSGLNLDGTNIQIGHWEAGGLARTTHQEFNGRVTHLENEAVSSHSTHTACTMIGAGVDVDARGMASNATIVSRRSGNDEAEIADFGAAGGILSNHSYSSGNPNGNIPYYGLYTENTREWDEILYNAPYLTLCKSAGNTRNDGVNVGDNGYDLVYTTATSKNAICVGAVQDVALYTGPSSIVHSAFSSWGPTDDWRIKPDLVANGVTLYSADDDDDLDYTLKNGTSMSTPVVTGTVALLQQHFNNTNGAYMKAATVKALLLCTTDEAGASEGPDFEFGWGLLNAERAAEVISNDGTTARIDELSLSNGNSYTTTFYANGATPFSLTVAWTDPHGTPITGITDNQTPMLVNDLDVRILKGAEVYEPWVMTPNANSNNFTDAATKGDNFRDNVERIDINNLPQGVYTVTVSHKGSLQTGSQDFSMVMKGNAINTSSLEKAHDNTPGISIYPNPSENGFFNVLIPEELSAEKYEIQIIDLMGRIKKSEMHYEKSIKLDISDLSQGTYVVRVEAGDNSFKKLVIVEQ